MSSETFANIFDGKQSKFQQKVNVDSGLLSKLEECGIITDIQRAAVEVTFVSLLKFSSTVLYWMYSPANDYI